MWELKLRLFTNTDRRNTAPKQPSPSNSSSMDAQDLEQVRSREDSNAQASTSGSSSVVGSEHSQSQSLLQSQPSGDGTQKTARELEDEADEAKYGKIPETGDFVVHGTVYCQPEHADSLAELYSRMTKIAKTEPGIIYYSLARSSADPSVFFFFEHYASKEDFVRHTQREESQIIFREGWFRDCVARFEKAIV